MALELSYRPVENLEDAEFVYNCYWKVGEPESSVAPFSELSDDEQMQHLDVSKKINQIVMLANHKVGFVTMDEIPEGINLGGAVLPQYRDMGIGKTMLKVKADELKAEGIPHVFVSARKDNIEAQKALEDAGFIFFADEEKPPIGSQTEPMIYSIYKV